MRKVYEKVEVVKRPQNASYEFAEDVEGAIKSLQSKGYEVEVQTQNIKDHFSVLLLAYKMNADYTDY